MVGSVLAGVRKYRDGVTLGGIQFLSGVTLWVLGAVIPGWDGFIPLGGVLVGSGLMMFGFVVIWVREDARAAVRYASQAS